MLCYVFCHIDNGIFAVSNEAVIKDLSIDESEMGLLTGALYIGNISGSLVLPLILTKFRPKTVVIFAAIMNALTAGVFPLTKIYWIIFVSRVLVGIFQVVFMIYFPVWIDVRAAPKKKSIWLSIFILTGPFGLVLGMILTTNLIKFTEYKWVFLA